jgi:hypothetical protein
MSTTLRRTYDLITRVDVVVEGARDEAHADELAELFGGLGEGRYLDDTSDATIEVTLEVEDTTDPEDEYDDDGEDA